MKENWEERGDDSFFAFPRLFVLAGMDGIVFFFLFRSQESYIEFQVAAVRACVSRVRLWAFFEYRGSNDTLSLLRTTTEVKFIPNEQGEYRDLILLSSHTFLSSTLNISFPGRSPRLYYHDNARPFSSPPPPPPFFAIVFSPQVRTKTDNQVSEKKEEK